MPLTPAQEKDGPSPAVAAAANDGRNTAAARNAHEARRKDRRRKTTTGCYSGNETTSFIRHLPDDRCIWRATYRLNRLFREIFRRDRQRARARSIYCPLPFSIQKFFGFFLKKNCLPSPYVGHPYYCFGNSRRRNERCVPTAISIWRLAPGFRSRAVD